MVALKCHYKNYLPSVTAISCHGRGTKIFFQAHLFELANLQNSGLIEHRPASDLISVPFKLGFSRVPVNNAIGLLPSLLSKLFKREVDLSFVKIYQKHMIKEFFLFIFSICTKTSQVRNLQLIILEEL